MSFLPLNANNEERVVISAEEMKKKRINSGKIKTFFCITDRNIRNANILFVLNIQLTMFLYI